MVPAYCELATTYGLALFLRRDGRVGGRSKIPVAENAESLQPSLVPLDSKRILSFSRTPQGGVGVSKSSDGGKSWSASPRLEVDSLGSSVAAFLEKSGQIFLVANLSPSSPSSSRRSRLGILRADAADLSAWEIVAELENEPGCEFSYPSTTTLDGRVYLTYTWKREAIKIVDITPLLTAEKIADEKTEFGGDE